MNNTPPILPTEQQEDDEDPPPDASNHTIAYDLLNDAIRVILKQSSTETPVDIKPYRLLTSLFDKPQIGPVILDSILYDVFRALYLSCLHQQKQKNVTVRCVSFNGDITSLKETEENLSREFLVRNCQELIKNANLLFNTLQNYYIWWYIEKMYKESVANLKSYKKTFRDCLQINEIGSGAPSVLEICILTDFLLDIIPVESYADSTSEILPNLFNRIVSTLKENIEILNKYEIVQSLRLCSKILSKIQPISLVNAPKVEVENDDSEVRIEVNEVKETKGLEKSKSDSKINENLNKNELTIDDLSRERSNSNQMLKKKEKTSPKIEKKSKNKKSKSSSKLYDLKNDDLEIVVEKTTTVQLEPPKTMKGTMRVENKSFLKCLEEYKQFYVNFIKVKIIPDVNIPEYFETLVSDKEERTRELQTLLDCCLTNTSIENDYISNRELAKLDFDLAKLDFNRENTSSDLELAMTIASDVLLEFSTFPNCLDGNESTELPFWLKALIVCACCGKSGRGVQIVAMNTLLEIFSLAKSRRCEKDEDGTKVVEMGILEGECVTFVEEGTVVFEVSIIFLKVCFQQKAVV